MLLCVFILPQLRSVYELHKIGIVLRLFPISETLNKLPFYRSQIAGNKQ